MLSGIKIYIYEDGSWQYAEEAYYEPERMETESFCEYLVPVSIVDKGDEAVTRWLKEKKVAVTE